MSTFLNKTLPKALQWFSYRKNTVHSKPFNPIIIILILTKYVGSFTSLTRKLLGRILAKLCSSLSHWTVIELWHLCYSLYANAVSTECDFRDDKSAIFRKTWAEPREKSTNAFVFINWMIFTDLYRNDLCAVICRHYGQDIGVARGA